MKWKIICAYLKAFQNTEEWRFSICNIFFVLEILTFSIMQIRSMMTSYCLQLKSGKFWISDISGNIEAVLLKLGTTNVHLKRNEMTPCCHSNCFGSNLFLSKAKYPHFQPLKWDRGGSYLKQTLFPYCLHFLP